jgi:hypothetical protein
MPQTLVGRLQMYLVLGALANTDVVQTPVFKENSTVGEGRDIMFRDGMDIRNNEEDFKTFKNRAMLALTRGGFSQEFIDAVNWGNFQGEGVWAALKLINEKLQLLDVIYDGTDCPCLSVLTRIAVVLEKEMESTRREPIS